MRNISKKPSRFSSALKTLGISSAALICSFLPSNTFAEDLHPIAIIGGQGSAPYAAFIQSDGTIKPLNALPVTGLTYRVDINSTNHGLIGGTNGINAYAAFVSPNGVVQNIPGLIAPGEIYTVSINEAGIGMIGGGRQATNVPYAAIISPGGVATPFAGLPANGLIYGVAIEESGAGIIGGIGPLNSAYAALTSVNGTVTPLTGLPTTGGIFWVAANDSGTKFIGGSNNTSAYAAFVKPQGVVEPINSLPAGLLYSVGINNEGNAIIGGSASTLPYAALVRKNGAVKTINGLPTTPGIIYNTAINDTGTGLIAGFSGTGPFGSFVASDGALTLLKGLPVGNGFLDGAALHSSGAGIVGGTSFGAPFVALAAPNGNLTYLTGLPADGEINSIAISIFDELVPESIGPFDSWANTQFTFSNTLTQHCVFHHRNYWHCDCSPCETHSLWIAPFVNYVHQKSRDAIPSYNNKLAGAMIGFDYNINQNFVWGGGFAYGYNDVHYSKGQGHTKINQESLVLYASCENTCFYTNFALWGGLFQAKHKRHSLSGTISSRANPYGWNLAPHLDIGAPFWMYCFPCSTFEPFISLDWANNWQYHYREKGSSGFNIALKKQYASILRSEAGLRIFQTLACDWGLLIVEEKGSYVNRTALQKGVRSAAFIGSESSFEVETLCRRGQNHGLVEFHLECQPYCSCDVYGSFDYQGEFGCSFESQTLTFALGKNF